MRDRTLIDGPAVPKSAVQVAEHLSIPLRGCWSSSTSQAITWLPNVCLRRSVPRKGALARPERTAPARVRMILRIGMDTDRVQQADGSALSRFNFVSPRNMVRLLSYIYTNRQQFRDLYDLLPIAGVDGSWREE